MVGDKIRKYRILKNMTTQELGMKLGFPMDSATIRICQYESNTRTPRPELLERIANILDVDIEALTVPDLTNPKMLKEVLQELEQLYSLKIVLEVSKKDLSSFII